MWQTPLFTLFLCLTYLIQFFLLHVSVSFFLTLTSPISLFFMCAFAFVFAFALPFCIFSFRRAALFAFVLLFLEQFFPRESGPWKVGTVLTLVCSHQVC